MGSRICSKFRKFKKRFFRKKERYDRFEDTSEHEATDFGDNEKDGTIAEAETLNPQDQESAESKNNNNDSKPDSQSQLEEIREWVVSLEEQLKDANAICSVEKEDKAEILSNLGAGYYKLCEFNTAKKYYELHLKELKTEQPSASLQRAYCNLGCVYRRLGEFDKAEDYFQNGIEISDELSDLKAKGRLLNNLGNIYEMRKDFEGAIYFHSKRRTIAEKLGDWESEAKACASLGNAYHLLGNLRSSIVFYERLIVWLRRNMHFNKKKRSDYQQSTRYH